MPGIAVGLKHSCTTDFRCCACVQTARKRQTAVELLHHSWIGQHWACSPRNPSLSPPLLELPSELVAKDRPALRNTGDGAPKAMAKPTELLGVIAITVDATVGVTVAGPGAKTTRASPVGSVEEEGTAGVQAVARAAPDASNHGECKSGILDDQMRHLVNESVL